MSKMFGRRLWAPVLLLFLIGVTCSAGQFCSETINPVQCVACTDISTTLEHYKCPRQCESNTTGCDSVCSKTCVDSECEYSKTGELRCSKGCVDTYSGSYCQQRCSEGCLRCRRKNAGRCIQCKQGLYGRACDKSCGQCLGETCDTSGACTVGCKPGWSGNRCDKPCDSRCKGCDDLAINCSVCDRTTGKCLAGCNNGFYGARCNKPCPSRCTQCLQHSGNCTRCQLGWYGDYCHLQCENCNSAACDILTGSCTDCSEEAGCNATGLTTDRPLTSVTWSAGVVTREHSELTVAEVTDNSVNSVKPRRKFPSKEGRPAEKDQEKDEESGSGLASMFQDQDYLLPVVGCGLVVCAVIALVIFCKCKRSKSKKRSNEENEEGSKCNGVSPHPSVHRTSGESGSKASDITRLAGDTLLCKDLLLDPPSVSLVPFGEKSLSSLRSRSGNSSVPFMDPIAEDEEDEESEEEDPDSLESGDKINIYLCPEDLLCSPVSVQSRALEVPDIVIDPDDKTDEEQDYGGGPEEIPSECSLPSSNSTIPDSCFIPIENNSSPLSTPDSVQGHCEESGPDFSRRKDSHQSQSESETGYSSMGDSESDTLISPDTDQSKPKYISRHDPKSRIPRAYRPKSKNAASRLANECYPSEAEPMLC